MLKEGLGLPAEAPSSGRQQMRNLVTRDGNMRDDTQIRPITLAAASQETKVVKDDDDFVVPSSVPINVNAVDDVVAESAADVIMKASQTPLFGPTGAHDGAYRFIQMQLPAQLPMTNDDKIALAQHSQKAAHKVSHDDQGLKHMMGSHGPTTSTNLMNPLLSLPPGKIGKIRVFADGHATMMIGDVSFDIMLGSEPSCTHHVIAAPSPLVTPETHVAAAYASHIKHLTVGSGLTVGTSASSSEDVAGTVNVEDAGMSPHSNATSPTVCILGDVAHRLVVVPDLTSLLQ